MSRHRCRRSDSRKNRHRAKLLGRCTRQCRCSDESRQAAQQAEGGAWLDTLQFVQVKVWACRAAQWPTGCSISPSSLQSRTQESSGARAWVGPQPAPQSAAKRPPAKRRARASRACSCSRLRTSRSRASRRRCARATPARSRAPRVQQLPNDERYRSETSRGASGALALSPRRVPRSWGCYGRCAGRRRRWRHFRGLARGNAPLGCHFGNRLILVSGLKSRAGRKQRHNFDMRWQARGNCCTATMSQRSSFTKRSARRCSR